MKHSFIIVGAVEEELTACRSALRDLNGISFTTTGIGAISAAATMTSYLGRYACDTRGVTAVFVGSVGAYTREIPLFSLVVATAARYLDAGAADARSFYPPNTVPDIPSENSLFQTQDGDEWVRGPILTTPSITRSEALATLLSRTSGSRFENLELYGLALACSRLRVAWTALSCVANYVAPTGHEEWNANRLTASKRTAVALALALRRSGRVEPGNP